MHPVFQEILNSPSLKGTLFVPTAAAWDAFFSTVRQRHGNPEAPAMVARYGQVMLYHLAQDINVPIATPTPGAPKFAFDTASTLQCSVGPGLPNNRIIVKKTPQAILLQHGTGNATIVSQPIGYCGGEAYLVNEVLVPCSDVAAVMGEIANVPSPCKNNVEGVLHRDGLSYYNALLLATGVNRPIFASGARRVLIERGGRYVSFKLFKHFIYTHTHSHPTKPKQPQQQQQCATLRSLRRPTPRSRPRTTAARLTTPSCLPPTRARSRARSRTTPCRRSRSSRRRA
jgi:hypothetical protein